MIGFFCISIHAQDYSDTHNSASFIPRVKMNGGTSLHDVCATSKYRFVGFIPRQKKFRLGITAGLGSSYITTKVSSHSIGKFAWNFGGIAQYAFNPNFSLNSGVIVQNKGGKHSGWEHVGPPFQSYVYLEKYNMLDIAVPLHAQLNVWRLNNFYNLSIHAGPDFHFNMIGVESRKFEDASYGANGDYKNAGMSNLEAFSLGASYGLTFNRNNPNGSRSFLKFGMNHSLTSIGLIDASEASHHILQLSFGYLFK